MSFRDNMEIDRAPEKFKSLVFRDNLKCPKCFNFYFTEKNHKPFQIDK